MTDHHRQINNDFINSLSNLAAHGFRNAADGISNMIGMTMAAYKPTVTLVPLLDISHVLGGPEVDAVSIYLKVKGDISSHMLLIMSHQKSLETVDHLLGIPQGTTQNLGSLERSALAEMGNLTGSFFLNAISDLTGLSSRPSPPVVIVDMVEAILGIFNALVGDMEDDIMLVQATFMVRELEINTDFWVIFDANTLEKLTGDID